MYSTELYSVQAKVNLQHQLLMSILGCSYFARHIIKYNDIDDDDDNNDDNDDDNDNNHNNKNNNN